jgi:hypothetical protein
LNTDIDSARQHIKSQQRSNRPAKLDKPITFKNNSEVDKVSYESARRKFKRDDVPTFVTGIEE